jgi:hypothetical protein
LQANNLQDPNYLATCPDVLAPRLDAIGTVGNPDSNQPEYHTFTVAGRSYIVSHGTVCLRFYEQFQQDNAYQPFNIKVRVNKSNKRWANFGMPFEGNSIYVAGPIVDREPGDTGPFVIELTHMTYLARTNTTASNKPLSKGPPTPNTPNTILQQRALKRQRPGDNNDDEEEGPSTPTRRKYAE